MAKVLKFELTKWYADCVTERGEAFIVYSAKLASPPIHYTSLLSSQDGGGRKDRFSLRKQLALEVREDSVAWASPAWKADGLWRDADRSIHEVLYESSAGSLEWDCIAPRAAACIRVGEQQFCGWGYVERLRLSIPPWRLPIRKLRWGRFVNATDALVWIDWRGSYNRRVAYYNGAAVRARCIGDRKIVLPDCGAVLSLEGSVSLREGTLGTTALAVIPHVERIFPAAILKTREQKWLSQAVLRRPNQPDSIGIAIHEVVEWS